MTQDEALAILESGASALLTGAAGTGKTYLLNRFIKRARANGKSVAVTATTGLAATHLNGNTIHSWSGIGVKDEVYPRMLETFSKQRTDLILNADVLVIDEISMLHDFRLDMVEEITRKLRGGDRPFGGLQVVLCGDFYQLPPINRYDSKSGGFVTGSKIWNDGHFEVCYLREQYRQADDEGYTKILNGIRAGMLTRRELDALQARAKATIDPFLPHTRLLTTNQDVDDINLKHLEKIDGELHEYEMETSGGKQYVESLKKSCLAPETLLLKKGAVVMCIKNSAEKKYVNGSLGEVIAFEPGSDYPIVKLLNGREVTMKPDTWELMDGEKRRAQISQIPLRLAWAITVHKSQGMTLDAARIDLSKAFVEGMGYVALSRVRGLESLVLDGLNGMALRVSADARRIDEELRQKCEDTRARHEKVIEDWHAREAKRKTEPKKKSSEKPKVDWQTKLDKMRAEYSNAYKPWQEKEDEKLIKLFASNDNIEQLSKLMGRHPGSIRARLRKHFGEGIV